MQNVNAKVDLSSLYEHLDINSNYRTQRIFIDIIPSFRKN